MSDDTRQPPSPASAPASSPSPTPKKLRPTLASALIAVLIAAVGILLVLRAWSLPPFQTGRISTDNAYVRGQVTVLAPQVSGYVSEVLVQDYAQVEAGQALVKIDTRNYEAALALAQAQLANAKAQLANSEQTQAQNHAALQASRAALAAAEAEAERARADLKRNEALAKDGAVSVAQLDHARAAARQADTRVEQARADIAIANERIKATTVNRDALQAQVEMADAQLLRARIDLDNTTVHAPGDGQVSEVTVRKGQYVSAGSQLLFVVPRTLWVIANFKETQMARVQPGQRASFTVDALESARLSGRVLDIAPATGSEFSVLKADNATGNFTKVVQRLPVKIAIDPDQPLAERLRPGMSVIAEVDTRETAQ
ncbi:HlyD family secretion protein [Thauera sp. SDU_THAU2]|uniref:HlyD family secretion protein n=1 Tax=Thauera sp. SDU_THAU2 TaxID=3136633 RepID=UPI00312004F6